MTETLEKLDKFIVRASVHLSDENFDHLRRMLTAGSYSSLERTPPKCIAGMQEDSTMQSQTWAPMAPQDMLSSHRKVSDPSTHGRRHRPVLAVPSAAIRYI